MEKFLSLTDAPGSVQGPGWTGHGASCFNETCHLPVAWDWNGVPLKPDHSGILPEQTWFVMKVVKLSIEIGNLKYSCNSKNTDCNIVSVVDIQRGKKSLHSMGSVKYRAFCMLLSTSTVCGLWSCFRFTVLLESTLPRFCRFSFVSGILIAISLTPKYFWKAFLKHKLVITYFYQYNP